jgi:hypothetical protein
LAEFWSATRIAMLAMQGWADAAIESAEKEKQSNDCG